jgi:hypothetical protein
VGFAERVEVASAGVAEIPSTMISAIARVIIFVVAFFIFGWSSY